MSAAGFVIAGRREVVDWIECTSWLDDPILRLCPVEFVSSWWPSCIVVTSTRGTASRPLPGRGVAAATVRERCASFWGRDERSTDVHLVVDVDGAVFQRRDLLERARNTGGAIDDMCLVVSLVQTRDGHIYDGQLDDAVALIDYLTARFGIQRSIPEDFVGSIERLQLWERGGFSGVVGARDCSPRRPKGDPGFALFYKLADAGYESFSVALSQDKDEWRRRQRKLGVKDNGIVDHVTRAALRNAGYLHGVWVRRPGDDEYEFDSDHE